MATLTVTHTENITLEGKNMGSTKTMTFTNIADVYSRILKFRQGTLTSLYTTHDNTVSGAIFDDSAVKYVRITNLGVEDLQIVVIAENTLEFAYEIKPNQSFYLYSHQLVVEADDSDAITTAELATLEDIDEVKAHCQKGNAKVEIFAASTDHLAV